MLVGCSASNKTDCSLELDRVGFWPSFALTKYFSSWRIKIMLALIVTWITGNCSGWLEFKAGFWFLIDFVRQQGVYWLGSFQSRLRWNMKWAIVLFCFSFTNCYIQPPPLPGGARGGHKTQEDQNFPMRHFVVFLCKTLALSFINGELPWQEQWCRLGPHPGRWLPSQSPPTYNSQDKQRLKCKDQTEAGMTKSLHCFSL